MEVKKNDAAETRIGHRESVVDTNNEKVAPMEWVSVVPTQMSEVNLGAPDSSGFVMTPRTVEELRRIIVSEPESETTRGEEAIRHDTEPFDSFHPEDSRSVNDASFQAAFAPKMEFKFGYYWNSDGVRHIRLGEGGNYTYKESSFSRKRRTCT